MKNKCPVCFNQMTNVSDLPIRDFDGSIFNLSGKVVACPVCGFCRVNTGLSDDEISAHYANASMYAALSGVGVGGTTSEDLVRYAHYEQFMRQSGCLCEEGGGMADIGCSRGGFIKYLATRQPGLSLAGVDCDIGSLKQLSETGLTALSGDISALPLDDESWAILSYFHVLEHVYDFDRVLREAFRVLISGGKLLLEVPDAEHYGSPECHVGVMFWAGMKEHVNHFSLKALIRLCERNGFGVTAVSRTSQPMKGGKFYPSLLLLAEKGGESAVSCNSVDPCRISDYFSSEVSSVKILTESIAYWVDKVDQVTFWGIGLEFFAIYPFIGPLVRGKRLQLIDSNPAKIGQMVDSIPISHPDVARMGGILVCCSYMANQEILAVAGRKGWVPELTIDIADVARLKVGY